MKAVKYIFGICCGLLLLVFIEGMFTLGQAFAFEQYSVFGWIIQTIAVVCTICASVMFVHEDLKPTNKPTGF